MPRIPAGWVIAIGAMLPDGLGGQGVRIIPSDVACQGCRIEMVRVATMGDADGPGMVHQQGRVTVDSKGRYYLVSNGDPGAIRLFDRTGRFVQMIGRRGRGPGEWSENPTPIVIDGDSVLVLDGLARRATILDPSFTPVASFILPSFAFTGVPLGDGRVVVTHEDRTGRLPPLQLIDRAGKSVLSFGLGEAPTLPSSFARVRIIGPAADRGSVWTGRWTEYLLERFDSTGQRTMALRRDTDWFRPWAQAEGLIGETRLPSAVSALFERGDSLWVFSRIDDLEWEPRPPVPYMGREDMTYTPDSYRDLLFDTMVEVIDVRTGRLLVSQRLRPNIVSVTRDGHAFTYEEDDDGNPRYVAWRLSVKR